MWSPMFAWYPVTLEDGTRVWWEWVQFKIEYVADEYGMPSYEWKYRRLNGKN